MNPAVNIKSLYLAGIAFILMNALFLYFEMYYFMLLPIVLIVLWAAFFKLDALILFIVACTPLSLNLEQLELGGVGFYLPTEPLLFGVLLLFIIKVFSGKSIDPRIYKHPIAIFTFVYLIWMFITSVTSEIPLVSFKFLIAKMWYIFPIFFIGVHMFQKPENIRRYFVLYLFPFMAVIIYTVVRHASFGFEKDAGHWVMEPFYKDHTSYGAVLAMYIPAIFGLLLQKTKNNLLKTILTIGLVVLVVGIVLSYTRAAWVSLVGALALLILMLLKVRLKTILVMLVAGASFVWMTKDDLLIMLEKNKQDSSDNLAEHVESISNVSSDASNLERLNRWNCALLMFSERPIVGWGPGTYQFVYAPFQSSQDLTIISTNNADGGNAHSEYLGPLSEQGIPGMLLMIVFVYMVLKLGFRLFDEVKSRDMKIIATASFLGLTTYFIHGVLNNYLDTDKASIPFWGFLAVMVAIDIYHKSPEAITE